VADEPAHHTPEPIYAPAGMVYVPGGEALVGSAVEIDENPERTVVLAPYYIDVCPVTCAEYAKFVAAAGHRAPKDWVGGQMPPDWADHPVAWLSWPDAAAYAEWAGKRLPTEEEWEHAARGNDGRQYPWGNDFDPKRCNCRASGIGRRTPVRQFPNGVSPFGCVDMAGNVWEWTASWHGEGADRRVLRGGSWGSGPMSVRACYRGRDFPSYWSNVYGLRCAKSAGG